MADEVIQDDHPEIKPAAVPKPEREPVTIEGEAFDVTPEPSDSHLAEELAAEGLAAQDLAAEELAAQGLAAEPRGTEEPEIAYESSEPEPVRDDSRTPPPGAPDTDPPFVRPFAPKPSRTAAFMAGGLGALAGAAIVLVAAYLYQPNSTRMRAANQHLGALDSAVSDEVSARKALDARLAALEAKTAQPAASPEIAALTGRLAALEGSTAKADALAAIDAEAKAAQASADKTAAMVASIGSSAGMKSADAPNPEVVKLIGDQQSLADRLAKMESQLAAAQSSEPKAPGADAGQQQALADRIDKLETGLAAVRAAPAGPDPAVGKIADDVKSLDDRIGKLEAALAAPKTEARADPSVTDKGDPIAQSVVAVALERRLFDGQPYTTEFAAIEKLGADPNALAALKPYAQTGAPTASALAAGFAKLAPSLRAPAKSVEHGDYAGTMWDEVKGLIKVHPVGETQGNDPAAVTTQVSAALGRGDLAAAKAAFAKFPESDRTSAAGWAKDLDGAIDARASAQSLIETSLGRMVEQKN